MQQRPSGKVHCSCPASTKYFSYGYEATRGEMIFVGLRRRKFSWSCGYIVLFVRWPATVEFNDQTPNRARSFSGLPLKPDVVQRRSHTPRNRPAMWRHFFCYPYTRTMLVRRASGEKPPKQLRQTHRATSVTQTKKFFRPWSHTFRPLKIRLFHKSYYHNSMLHNSWNRPAQYIWARRDLICIVSIPHSNAVIYFTLFPPKSC